MTKSRTKKNSPLSFDLCVAYWMHITSRFSSCWQQADRDLLNSETDSTSGSIAVSIVHSLRRALGMFMLYHASFTDAGQRSLTPTLQHTAYTSRTLSPEAVAVSSAEQLPLPPLQSGSANNPPLHNPHDKINLRHAGWPLAFDLHPVSPSSRLGWGEIQID